MLSNVKLVLAGVLALSLIGTHTLAWVQGGAKARAAAYEEDNKEMKRLLEWGIKQQDRANLAESALRAKLNEPKAAPQIKTVVRENPSQCVIPKPVDDRVREAGSKANASIRSSVSSN